MSSTQEEHPPQAHNTMIVMEQKMREQIRLLQEQRAAAMMEEVVDLQRERDLALGRIKSLKKSIEDLTMENAMLKGAIGKGDLTEKLLTLERNYFEERLLNNDLRKKLQVATKQKDELMLKVQKLESETRQTLSLYGEGQREKSRSMSNLNNQSNTQLTVSTSETSTTESSTPTAKLPPNGRKISPPLLSVGSSQVTSIGTRSGSSTPQSYSPTVIPRRYKLAAASTRDTGTQTIDHPNNSIVSESGQVCIPPDIISTLEKAKTDLIALQEEKENVETDLNSEKLKRRNEKAVYKKECKMLQSEAAMLKEALTEFSVWTRQKIQLFEEDMDIFKVVYSLHGSLSQEKAMLNELREKLTKAELKVAHLHSTNIQLQEELVQVEEKYKKCKTQIKQLREKPPTPPHYYSPASQHHVKSYKLSTHMQERPSSPLLSRTSPPLRTMFPVSTQT